jgi:tetratricopeptide (TPR) repeat protein
MWHVVFRTMLAGAILAAGLAVMASPAALAAGAASKSAPGKAPAAAPADKAPAAKAPDAPVAEKIPPAPAEKAPIVAADPDLEARVLHYYGRGRVYMLNLQNAAAAQEFRKAAVLAPHIERIWLYLGLTAYDADNKSPEGPEALDKALKLAPDDAAALYFRARIARNQQNAKLATEILKHLLSVARPDSPYRIMGGFHYGQLLQESNDLEGAIAQYEAVLELVREPQGFFQRYPDIAALFNEQWKLRGEIARLYLIRGAPDKAIPILTDLAVQMPKDPMLLDRLCLAYLQKKDFALARTWAKKMIEANPDNLGGYQRLADSYRGENNLPGILPDLEALHRAHPKNLVLTTQLADTARALGHGDVAAPLYRELLASPDKTPFNVSAAALGLAILEMQANRPMEALTTLADQMTPGPVEESLREPVKLLFSNLVAPDRVYQEAQKLVTDANKKYGAFDLVGLLAMQCKKPAEAVALFDKALAREPKTSIAYAEKAELLVQAKRFPEALLVCDAAIKAGLDGAEFHRKMGMILEYTNRPAEAIAEYRLAKRKGPDDKPSRLLLADLLDRSGQYDEAEKEVRELLGRFPPEPQTLGMLAALRLKNGDTEGAERAAAQSMALDPAGPGPKKVMAEVRNAQKRYAEAEQLARGILAAHPELAPVRIVLSNALAGQRKFKEAAAELVTVLAAAPDNVNARYLLSGVYAEAGDSAAAEKELGQILAAHPDHAPSNNDLGYLWADRGVNLDRAEKMIREALKTSPLSPTYLDSLGWVLYKQGKFDDAAKALQQAAGVRPDPDAEIWDHLGDVYWRLSQKPDAANAWESAVKRLKTEGEEKAADLKRIEKKVQSLQAGQTPDVAPLAAKQ